ncbi:MAG: MarR family winged helix-turn-helix transcriptional regulator [Candidatus Acidiferrales bacterium]
MKSRTPRADLDQVFVGRLLLGRVLGALVDAHDRALAPLGLTAYQGTMLLNCARQEGNTPVELAALNGLYVSTITRMADRLEKKGLLTRTRSRKDRRQVILRITPKGRAVLRKGVPIAQRVALKAWRGVTEQERNALRSIVYKILGNLGHKPIKPIRRDRAI